MQSLTKFARLGVAALILCACAFTGVARARTRQAGLGSLTAISAPSRPGARSPAVSSKELASQFEQTTGVSPSQVIVENVCPAARPGYVTCAAQTVVLRSNHQLVRPHLHASRALTQVTPAGGAAAPATGAGTAAPSPETPAWLQQAYDLSYLSQTNGSGTTVGIVDDGDDPTSESDLATFRARYGLPPCTTANGCYEKVNETGQQGNYPPVVSTDWESESALDVDAVSALCPHCHILLVEAGNNNTNDMDAALQEAVSLGATIVSNSWSATSTAPLSGTYTFPGVSVIASTGDHGYAGPGVDAYPAAYPGVTAAGGTNLAPTTTSAPSARGFTDASWALDSSNWGATSGCDTQEPKPAWQADTGCTGRAYADLSADADPATGLAVYSTANGGWILAGGTSLASPLIAAYEAVTGVNASTPQWAYTDSSLLNDPSTSVNGTTPGGNNGNCASNILYICNAGVGYDGPTGIGSISGDVVQGGPGIGGPSQGAGSNTYTRSVSASTATLTGGVYPNGVDTTYHWEYGATASYGQQTTSTDIGSGQAATQVTDTITGLTAGTTYHYRLVATNADGTTYGYDYTLTTASAGSVAPVNTTLPTVSGTATQGQTLSTSTGAWTPNPTGYTYQWQRSADGANWTNISGATNSTYALTAADIGDDIEVVVTATDAWGNTGATAIQVGPVSSATPVNTSQPVISGNAKQGETISTTSTWSPSGASLTYQWQRSADGSTWTTITGATGAGYTLSVADEGDSLRVIVTATNSYGSASATSQPVGPIHSNPPVVSVDPTVTGSPQRTFTLTATQGTWSGPQNTYAYQWQRSPDGSNWTNISGASNASYTLAAADEGDDVRVLVTASNADGLASAASNATTPIDADPPQNNTAPSISGSAERSMTLSAAQGSWSGPDNTYSYQWQRDAGDGYLNIQGATANTYALTTADERSTVRVVVTATNPDGTIVQASQASGTVQAAAPVNSAAPTVTGNALRGSKLVAAQGTWQGAGNTYTYQWQSSLDGSTWSDIHAATGGNYTLGVGDEGTELRVEVTAANADGTATAVSQPTTTVPSSPPVNTTAPSILGTAQRTSLLSADIGVWSGIGNAYTYQWQHSADGTTWTDITGATGAAYTVAAADENDTLRLKVTASNLDGTVTAASQPTSAIPTSPPVNTTAPTLAGTAQRGGTLTAAQGAWGGIGNVYTYQWQRSTDSGSTWTNVSGATSLSHSLGLSDEGAEFRLQVTATNPDATVTATTAASGVVAASLPNNTAVPVVTGAAQRGGTLTATQGAWGGNGNADTYQWQRSADGTTWTTITGATSASYTVGTADEGDTLQVVVTATNADGTATASSAATTTVAAAQPVNTAAPTLSGTAVRAGTLSVSNGTWTGIGNSYAIQWQRNTGSSWTNITGQTGNSYTLGTADENATLRAVVTATNADGTVTAATAASATVPAVPPVNTSVPALSGTAQRGLTLTATQGSWNGVGNSYTVQWQRSADQGTTWTNITGATGYTYSLAVGDEGDTVRAQVTAANPDSTVTASTTASSAVQASAPANSVSPTMSGNAQRSSTLSSTQGTWSGNGNTYTVEWQRSADHGTTWTNITGATGSSYTLAVADEGDTVRLDVTATNADGSVSAASAASATVAGAPPVNTRVPSVTGTAIRNVTLTADEGSWTGVGNGYQAQWQRSADQGQTWTNITAATGASYQLVHADVGDEVRFLVTVSNTDGTVSVASAPTSAVSADPPVNTVAPSVTGTLARSDTLTATGGTWLGAGSTYGYQWQHSADQGQTWTNISGGTSLTYVLQKADEGDNVRLVVTDNDPDGSSSVASAATAAVQAAPPANTGLPSVSGLAGQGQVLTAQTGTWQSDVAGYSYVWQHGDPTNGYTAISGATSSTYTPTSADVGETIRVIVTASNADASVSATSAATDVILGPPQSTTAPPAPAGTLQNTFTVSASSGSWNQQNLTYGYVWMRCPAAATAITNACTQLGTGNSYAVASADVGSTLGYTVTASGTGGKATASSALSAVITGRPLTNQTLPHISGNPQVTQTLTTDGGAWSVPLSSVSYVWERCDTSGSNCQPISGATSASYLLASADNGQTVRVIANVTSPGQTASATSAPVTIEAAPVPEMLSAPQVQGSPVRGVTLAAGNGQWSNSPTGYAYIWERCDSSGSNCQPITGITGQFYTLASADEGQTVTVKVTASNTAGSGTATAQPVGPVASLAPIAGGQPTIQTDSPTITEGAVLGMQRPTWQTTSDTTYSAAWERCDTSGGSCHPITGATNWQYTATTADVGSTLRAVETATNYDGTTTATSAATSLVTAGAPRWKTLPSIGPDPGKVGDVLSITAGTWTGPALTSDTVQMQRCTNTCSADGTANVHSYTITNSDLGALLMISETAANAGGSVTVWSPRYIGPVISAAAGAAVLSGGETSIRNTQGQTLATAKETTGATAAVLVTHLRHAKTAPRTIAVRRAPRMTGKLIAWACQVKLNPTGKPGPCTNKIRLTGARTLTLPRTLTGKVRVVVVKKG
jgi:hypothetical protein